uniref:Ribosomal protein S10 n=1 Tax=Chlorokybus atmophyticus TaxID=3144 RepID=A6YEB1_CHLAT|nr:ribosomal protein S10 [Chlorokybus atmophyticus]ABO15114.1 ribosomal protein S10 [Chlorokybus atmophyticus]
MVRKIAINLKSFEKGLINKSVIQIISLCESFNFKNNKVIYLPTAYKRFTVLRSPHIDKKSREQFEMKTFKRLLSISFPIKNDLQDSIIFHPNRSHKVQTFLQLLKRTELTGVQLKITVYYDTKSKAIPDS